MAFTFQTTTDGSAATHDRVQPGWYEAVVLSATEKQSKGGSPMIELNLGVDVGRMKPFELRAWLVLTTAAAWKIEQFLAATGKRFAKGEQLSIDARECEGKRLCVTLCNRVTDKGGLWPDILDFRRREDCPRLGAMSAEEYDQWWLNPDGTRATKAEREAAGRKQFAELRDGLDEPAPRQGQGARSFTPEQLAEEMADDDIPF